MTRHDETGARRRDESRGRPASRAGAPLGREASRTRDRAGSGLHAVAPTAPTSPRRWVSALLGVAARVFARIEARTAMRPSDQD